MRNVIDELVEKRKSVNWAAYDKLQYTPYNVMDVKDYRNSIKLDKGLAEDVAPMYLNNMLVSKNIMRAGTETNCKVIVRGKEYEVAPDVFILLRGHILSAISCSEVVSKAYSDAIVDWFEGNNSRVTDKQVKSDLYSCLYKEAFSSLCSILNLRGSDIDSAIASMIGE